jgi:hypothetical protein
MVERHVTSAHVSDALKELTALAKVPKIAPRTKIRLGLLRNALVEVAKNVDERRAELLEEHRKKDARGNPVPVYQFDEHGVIKLKRGENGEPLAEVDPEGNPVVEDDGRPVHQKMTVEDKIQLANPVAWGAAMRELTDTEYPIKAPGFTEEELDTLAGIEGVTFDHLSAVLPFVVYVEALNLDPRVGE